MKIRERLDKISNEVLAIIIGASLVWFAADWTNRMGNKVDQLTARIHELELELQQMKEATQKQIEDAAENAISVVSKEIYDLKGEPKAEEPDNPPEETMKMPKILPPPPLEQRSIKPEDYDGVLRHRFQQKQDVVQRVMRNDDR